MFRDAVRGVFSTIFGNDSWNKRSSKIALGQHFPKLRCSVHQVDDQQIISLESDISQIGRNLVELSDRLLNQYQQDQNQSISIGINSNVLKSRLSTNEKPDTVRIKESIGNHFQLLNEKLTELKSLDVDDTYLPVLGSTINQLVAIVQRIETTIESDEILQMETGKQLEYLNDKIEQATINSTNMDSTDLTIQLSIYSKTLENKLKDMKNIFFRRYTTKFKELIENMKLKYETDYENYRQMTNLKNEFYEFLQYCIQSNMPVIKVRSVFHEKLKNDLEFKHYFKQLLIKYQRYLFQSIVNESIHYIPKSKLYLKSCSCDEKYSLCKDIEQTNFLFNFLIQLMNLNHINNFPDLVENQTPILQLFMKNIHNSNSYLKQLKESYLVFIRDRILPIYDREENNLKNNIRLKVDEIKQFNEESFKLIHDSERQEKNVFIQQFRGLTWNEKLNVKQIDTNDNKVTELAMLTNDDEVEKLKINWLSSNNLDDYGQYEYYVLNMQDSIIKSRHLFEISRIYNDKQPCLNVYLKKSIEFLNSSISIDEFLIDSSNCNLTTRSDLRTHLRLKYELRGLIRIHMASRYSFACFDKFNYLNMATWDFLQFDNLTTNESKIKYNEKNYIQLFKNAFQLNNDSSIDVYDKILTINPYFFPAQYQKLLKFYELNDCSKISHIHSSFHQLNPLDAPLLDLFRTLINKKKTKRKSDLNKPSDFLNKTIKIRINNNQHTTLYLKLVQTEHSYQLQCNNEEQLINLLKYGKINMVEVKYDQNKSLKLKYQLLNFSIEQMLNNLHYRVKTQEGNFLMLIKLFKSLELSNEYQYKNLDEKFLRLLPETRLNLIRINSNYFQTICEISRAIKEFQTFTDHDVKKKILQLKIERTNIYRTNKLFYLEELELLEILNNQIKNSDHNPIIYYRLSYLNRQRGNLQKAINYINLAKKKYYEKVNKPIFRKINKFQCQLSLLEQEKLNFIEKNRMNLFQIWNLVCKFNMQRKISMINGFQMFSSDSNRDSLIDCLFYHLIEDTNGIEEFLTNNQNDCLTKKFNELQNQLKIDPKMNRNQLIANFNKRFQSQFKCLFVDEKIDYEKLKFVPGEIPIILTRDKDTNRYQTVKELNHFMFLSNLLTTYDAKKDLKSICSTFLNEEIGKNILIDSNENENIEIFIKSMVNCDNIKMFTEDIVYYLTTSDYNENCFCFWSSIADFEHYIDLLDTLNYFKELFRVSIEEHQKEEEEKHKSALQTIDDLIQQNQNEQKYLILFNKLKDAILLSLSQYVNISSGSTIRKEIDRIISSNNNLSNKLQKLIDKDCLNIDLEFSDDFEELQFYEYLRDEQQSEMVYKIFLVIEEVLSIPKIQNSEQIIIIESYNIILSELIVDLEKVFSKSKIREVKFYGTNIFIDHSLINDCWHGIDLIFASDTIHFIQDKTDKKITLDVSGRKGEDGKNAEDQPHAKRESEDGNDGLPGSNGEAGQNGGHIYLIAKSNFNGKQNIEKLITSGGPGGKGGNGGNAGNGFNGKDGANATEENYVGILHYGYHLTKGKPGTRGGNGGTGGDAGLAGLGGRAGIVYIEEQRTVITDGFTALIESIDRSNECAVDGLPGQGGKGGVGGADGNDILYHKPTGISKNKVYRGNINVTGTKDTFWEFYVYFDYEERPKKRNGIDNAAGKSANAQLNSGKKRNKSDNKTQSNEQQIESDSKKIIDRNNEESQSLSQNVTKSLNLLKDQATDMIDERQLKVKTHQLSNSMLENAHKIAQESLALNAIKAKAKMENTILKTSDTNSNKANDKLLIHTKLKFDQTEQEIVHFKKTNFINDLQSEYQTRIERFQINLNKTIKKLKDEIKLLKFKGKNIFFKVDIDTLENTFLSIRQDQTQIDLSRLFENESNINLLFNQDLSTLTNHCQSLSYDPKTKKHEPFLLDQYFTQLNNLRREKRTLIRIKNKLNQLNVAQFIVDLCLEYGNEKIIEDKLTKFNEIFDLNVINQLDSFNINDFVKEIYLFNHSKTIPIETITDDSTFLKDISNYLIQSNFPLERINEFTSILSNKLNEKFQIKEYDLNQYSPIYHRNNEQQIIDIHPIEESIFEYIESKEKNPELIVRMLKSLFSILEMKQENLLCKTKLERFLQFLFNNLISIKTDFQYGHLFHTMKHCLNSIKINYSSTLFNHLELIILVKEKQYNDLKKCTEKIESFFHYKQTEHEMEMKTINYIQHNRKTDIFKLFQEFNGNDNRKKEYIEMFINNLYLTQNMKTQIHILLNDFYNYLKNRIEYEFKFILNDKKIFLEKLHFFLRKQKLTIKDNLNYLVLNQERCETIIHRLYKSLHLQTNIQYLENIDTSTQLNVNDFIQNFKVLYDQLRLEEILLMDNVEKPKAFINQIDYNENICQILFIKRQMTDIDRTTIKNADRIIVARQKNEFDIYFRDRNDCEVQQRQLKQEKLIEILKNLKFDEELILSKEENKHIYKEIYQQIELNNGFTKYSSEQIESFEKLKEILNEKLDFLKKYLPDQFHDYVENQIDLILDSQSPDRWSFRIYLIFNNINTTLKIRERFPNDFPLTSSDKINDLNITTTNIMKMLKDQITNLFSIDKQEIFIDLYKCLSTFDYLLIKIVDDKFTYPNVNHLRDLFSNLEYKTDLHRTILYELTLKHHQILKEYFFNEMKKSFERKSEQISKGVDRLSQQLTAKTNLKEKFRLFFKDLISKRIVKLFNLIDDFYVQSLSQLAVITRFELYDHLRETTIAFNTNTTFDGNDERISSCLNNFMDASQIFIDYLEKYSLIAISGIKTIKYEQNSSAIDKILSQLKANYGKLEKCSLKFVSLDDFKSINDFKNEILLTEKNENEIHIKFQTLTGNKTDYLKLKQDDDRVLFEFLKSQNRIDENDRFYSLIKSKNGLIYKNQIQFEELIFIELFFKKIIERINEIPIDIVEDYFHSFQIILKYSNINSEILILFDEFYQNQVVQFTNQKLKRIFENFNFLLKDKYEQLINQIRIDFAQLTLNVHNKNRILNIIWKYLTNKSENDKNIQPVKFVKNQLNQIIFDIKTIFETNRFEIRDLVDCHQQLNKSLMKTPLTCLQSFENQLNSLQFKTRLFIENIDFLKNSPIRNDFHNFNNCLKPNQSIDNEVILNLLEQVLKHQTSFTSVNYEVIMKKILLNFRINKQQWKFEMLTKIEINIKQCEKSLPLKKAYLNFVIDMIKDNLICKYNEQLKVYQEKVKATNDSIQEILNLFWSNISMSELLNKEREKIYLHLNIEKLSKLDSENSAIVLHDLLATVKELQTNPDKKQFTIKIHQYLNQKINQQLTLKQTQIVIPIKLENNVESSVKNILEKKYDNENILIELSILFEAVISSFKDKPVFNEFFQSFAYVFKYFSWRLCDYQSKTTQDTINEALERLNSSIKIFKIKIEKLSDKYSEFYEFEKLYYLRTHETQLQQELNDLLSQKQIQLTPANELLDYWSKKLNSSMLKTDQSITNIGNEIFQSINENLFKTSIKMDKEKESSCTLIDENHVKQEIQETDVNEKVNIKVNFEDKIRALTQISSKLIEQEDNWENKKKLINYFTKTKMNFVEDYLKSMYEEQEDKSIDYEAFKNTTEIKHIQEILVQCDADEWNQEVNDLKACLFTVNLLEFYGLNFDILRQQYELIEELLSKIKDDNITKNIWQNEVKSSTDLIETVEFIKKYAKQSSNKFRLDMSLDCLIKQFIDNIKSIQDVNSSIDSLKFFIGSEQFTKVTDILQRKLLNSSKPIKLPLKKLSDLLYLLANFDDFGRVLELIENFKIENWLLYLNVLRLQSDLNILFNRYLDEMDLNRVHVENLDCLDEIIEKKYNEISNQYENSLKTISTTIKSIESNPNIELNDKEMLFQFLRIKFSLEFKKPVNNIIDPNDLDKFFNKYLIEINITTKIINSLKNKSSNANDQLIIENIYSKSINNLLPYLTRFWIIEQLDLNRRVRDDEAKKMIQYLELIKISYSEEKFFELIDLIKNSCLNQRIIPQIIIDLLWNISNNDWIFNAEIREIMKTKPLDRWEEIIENYMKEKRSKERNFSELINLMREDKNSLNRMIKHYLDSETIINDLQLLKDKLHEKLDDEIDKPVIQWNEEDIKAWALKTKGNKLLSNKKDVQNAIVVVSQAIYLFTREKIRPRETQLIALWLFLNPDLNKTNTGCLAQISTGEGKSIIVAGLAAIKALSCHRIDIITSSSVLAVRDAKEFEPFYKMFHLQVSNNCDSLCEQGDGQKTAEDIRKLRYHNDLGPVHIIYGECSCFERDILLTEFNKKDENQNIIGKRITENSVPSVIIDEVDSMLLDKASMVLYLSHNIDTLKALERIFISIWQTINQPTFDSMSKTMINDDMIQFVSDIITEQIDSKVIDIPDYDSNNCDYINMKLFIKRRMCLWIKSAFHVKEMIPNDTYIITQDTFDKSSKSEVKITVMDKDTGTEQLSTRWSNGVHQFLQLKHSRRLTPESLKAVFISNMSFFKRYQHNIAGLTGSLGSTDEQKLLDKVYKLRFFELPRFKSELFRELHGSVHSEQETWLEAIKNALDREIHLKSINRDKRRAVLIISENVKSVLIIKEYLANTYPTAKVYKSAYEKFEINELNPGDIIIATNLAGRGTDLGTSMKLEDNGGLHVIVTYLPTNVRIEMQAFGRTARKGNKGTGEYIILSKYSLSIEQLKQWRNIQEKERLDTFLNNDLPKIQIEEDLLQGFTDGDLSCIGFAKLYESIETKLASDSSSFYYGNQYIQYQLYSLKNRWAFWLDSMTEYINMINIVGKKKIIEKFHEFQSSIERDFSQNGFKKLIIEPIEFVKLGKYYRDKEDWSKAFFCYEQASKDSFYAFTNYYRSTCQQNINYGQGIVSKRELKRNLNQVKLLIDKEMQFLNKAAQVAFEIGEKNRQLGFANYGNEYDKQVKEKLTIWSIFSGTIISVNGSPIDAKDFTVVKYLNDMDQAEKLFKKLSEKKLIKPSRISKKFNQNIELPSIFNNERTRTQIHSYLKAKLDDRKSSSGHLKELNFEIFQKDIIKWKIFLPHLYEFINLVQKHGFIEQVKIPSVDELFVVKTFIKEDLDKKDLPDELDTLKNDLFECLQQITTENNFKGKITEIRNEIQRTFKLKSQKDLTQKQLDKFFEFLKQNAIVEKLVQYSVKKENILTKNKDLKNDYFYANLYDFERHYTDEFKKFELIFRRNFLKIILIEEELDKDISCFTLKDTIDSNDFELHKTQDDAIRFLWSYLTMNSCIKSPSVNIGLINSNQVKEKREQIKKEIESFFEKILSKDREKELKEAVDSVFNIIDQTIGDIKKLPDEKTIASYLEIKINYFLNNKKPVPDALDEFIELAFDVIFRLQEKKEPPKWYEIAAVIALGVVQIVAGVLAKMFIPFAGHLIGEFLISTGCDDVLFGVSCAITGEFSWDKYWEHKKQSMITSAITAVVFVGASFLKNAKKLESFQKAWDFQKLTGAKKLHTAAKTLGTTANIGKHVGKEIVKTLAQTGLSELTSRGVEAMLDGISNGYEKELTQSIKKSINDSWNTVESEMKEIFRISEGSDTALRIIDDCINRKLDNLPEAAFIKSFASHCGPVMQGLGRALGNSKGGKGVLIRMFTSYAPSLINLGVNVYEVAAMIGGFLKTIVKDLKDAKKSLKKTNKNFELTKSQTTQFQTFQANKIDLISASLSETLNQKLKSGIIAPVLNFAANRLISKGIESLAGADRIEQLANRFELIHAASNPDETLTQYADDLQIFINEGRPIDLSAIKEINPNEIYPANNNGCSLQQAYDLYGDKVKTYIGRDKKIYIRRPSSKQYYDSVRRDKPAGIHEQKKISEVLQCTVTNDETTESEQKCTLKRADGVDIPFVIKNNFDGTKHAEIIIDGKPVTLANNGGNKNDCYYNVALVANEMSQGKSFEEAVKILTDKDSVQNLRNNVSLAMKNDDSVLKEFRWTNQTNLQAHFDSLTGILQNPKSLRLELSDKDVENIKQWINRDKRERPDKFKSQTGVKEEYENKQYSVTYHHLIGWETVVDILKEDIKGLGNDEVKEKLENYLNDKNNAKNKEFILNEMRRTRGDKNENLERHNELKDSTILRQSIVWNPNLVVGGPSGSDRKFDPDQGGELKKYVSQFKNSIREFSKNDERLNEYLKYDDKIDKILHEKISEKLNADKETINRIGDVLMNGNEEKTKKIYEDIHNRIKKSVNTEIFEKFSEEMNRLKTSGMSNEDKFREIERIGDKLTNEINIRTNEKLYTDYVFKIDSELISPNHRDLFSDFGQTRNLDILDKLSKLNEQTREPAAWKKDQTDIFKRFTYQRP